MAGGAQPGAWLLPHHRALRVHADPERAGDIALGADHGLDIDLFSTTIFLGRATLLTGGPTKMAAWRKALYANMSRNAWNATTLFGIPTGRMVDLRSQVDL